MKVRLEVLASTCIKRKQPWPQIVWLGKEKESLFLLDDNRVSVLYVPSGKTKRNIQKLSSIIPQTVCLAPTSDGLYLVGVQSSGEVFVWNKDRDELKTIVGLASLLVEGDITPRDGCQAFPSPDCTHLLLVLAGRHVFLWQRQAHANDNKNNTLLGKWFQIKASSNIEMPSLDCKEVSMHAVFTCTQVYGDCCQLSVVFNQGEHVCVTSLLIQFNSDLTSSQQPSGSAPATMWTHFSRPLSGVKPDWEPIGLKGAYTCQYSHDGQVLAVGVNQKSPAHTSVVFLSTLTKAMLLADLKGCGLKNPSSKRGRQYWICDMAWTSDNLFLVIMLRNGSAALLSRLCDPLVIFSKGSSVELGPAYFLTFSPLITVQSDKKPGTGAHEVNPATIPELDPMHQRFSVTTHPSLPIVLFSDGLIVTIAQLPTELNPMIFMRDLVLESSSYLKQVAEAHRLDLTLPNAYNLPAGDLEGVSTHKNTKSGANEKHHYSFEEASINLNETQDSVSWALGTQDPGGCHIGVIQNMSSGKIIFGEQDLSVLSRSFLDEPDSTLKTLQLARANLFAVWKIAASSSEQWSANMDKILHHAVHNIIKLFSLVLDCAHIQDLLEEAGDQVVTSSVQTTSLFKVVSMYRQLLNLLQFDCLQRHLLPHIFQLSHKTLQTILSSVGLCQADPRIKTLTGSLTLLQFTEKSLQEVFIMLPRTLQSVAENVKAVRGEEESPGETASVQPSIELGKRLTSTWKLLYKYVTQFIDSDEMTTADVGRAQALKSAIEQHLIELDVDIPTVPTVASINPGERLSLDGKHTLAVDAWKDQLKQYQENGSMKNASQLFHSLLYTYILRNDFVAAIAFVDDLIVKANPNLVADLEPQQKMSSHDLKASVLSVVASTLRTQAMHDPDMMPCIRDKTIRQVVQSMARFMAAYFSNHMIFIFPPHNPAPLPPVHFETLNNHRRVVPKYHEDVAAIVRHQKLGSIWTVDRALEYLLLSGLVCEAAWFADRIGDWKAAYQLSIAHFLHRQVAPAVYERHKRPLTLPEWLTPDSIMKKKLEVLVKDDLKPTNDSSDLTYLTEVLKDISLAGIMGSVEVGPCLLEQLVAKLKSVVKQLPPLVAKELYLPAPPLFLPQPAVGEQRHSSQEALEETAQREKASSIIRLALCVMSAANLSLAATQWYVCALAEAQKKALQFKVSIEGPCVDLPDTLFQYTELDTDQGLLPPTTDNQSVLTVQSSFRDLCSIVWLLHVRDKLSLALRSREKLLNLGLDIENNEQWLRECFVTLKWAVHMLPFSRFLSDEASIYKVVLSLLLDFPATEDVAGVLAECMYDLENLHPEVQERLDHLLGTWQRIILSHNAERQPPGGREDGGGQRSTVFQHASPRGKSLSVYYHKQCMIMDKTIKRKKQCFGSYEEFVFSQISYESGKPTSRLNIGSRPFETKKLYVEFLDTFVSISFSHVLDSASDKNKSCSLPMLQMFSKDIVHREIMNFIQDKYSPAQKKQQGLSVFSAASQALARASNQEKDQSPARKNPEKIARPVPGRGYSRQMMNITGKTEQNVQTSKSGGLFRGMSMVDSQSERSYAPVRRYESEPVLDNLDNFHGSQPSPDISRRKQSLTEFTSSFWKSEENLHPGSGRRDQGKPMWSLIVSFGKKYTVLQQMVEWLELWGSKSHSLGVPGREKILDITPKIKIHMPAQLIVLALWLLEHKYCRSSTEKQGREKSPHGRRSAKFNITSLQFETSGSAQSRSTSRHSQKSASQKSGRLQTQEVAEHVLVQESRHDSVMHEKTYSQTVPALGLSTPPATLEHDEIIHAYTNLLDEHEESSSIDVSSLASDELDGNLKTTLNAIRRTSSDSFLKENSALNRTLLPNDETLGRPGSNPPQSRNWSSHVKQDHVDAAPPSHQSTHSQTDKNTNHPKSKHTSTELPNETKREDLGEGIANQLQGVIRDELRKIMEAQHRSVLAMMGALDGKPPGEITPALLQTPASASPSVSQKQANSQKQLKHQSRAQTSSKQQKHGRRKEIEMIDDESMEESLSLQAQSLSLGQAHRRQDKGERMRETLMELQNLQQTTKQYPSTSRHQQLLSQSEHVSAAAQNTFLGYPGPQDGNHLRLPFLPFQAWAEPGRQQQPCYPGFGTPRLPLLHINKSQTPDDAFANLRRFLPQVPPLQTHMPQVPPQHFYLAHPTQQFVPPPSTQHFVPPPSTQHFVPHPSTQPLFSFWTPPPQPVNEQPLPLLSVSAGEKPMSGFPLLRMLAPGSSYVSSEAVLDKMKQKEKIEETRQKLLRQFHEQLLQDKENAGQQILAHQMLHMETQDDLSARSEKSQTSLRSHSGSKVGGEPAEGQDRAASVQEQPGTDVVDASTSDTRISHGFALPRGVFDSYLQLGEQLVGPEVNETNAAFQLKMALAMQRQLEKKIRSKVDFSTMTQEQVDAAIATDPSMEVIRTAEAATSITRDTGVDPVQEVVSEYNMKRHNNLIPPDIFMGLRFGDLDAHSGVEPAAPSSTPGKGRSYLNVVDIRASAVLRDIPERTERPEPLLDQDHLDTAVLSSEKTVQQIGALEETLRQKFAPRSARSPGRGYDAVTVKVFDQLQPPANDCVSVAVLPRSSMSQPKAAVIRRLQDMSDQLKAIDEMSQNIERDFQSSHLLLRTIQEINGSVQRSRSSSPVRTGAHKSQKELRYSIDDEEEEGTSRHSSPDLPAPKSSAKSPQVSARTRTTYDSRSGDRRIEPDNELTKLIAEVLVQEGVDLQAVGFSQEMVEQLERDARKQIQKSSVTLSSDLKDQLVNMKQADEHLKSRTPKEREQLKVWMTKKFHQRQEEYMKRRNELIQREPKPFRSQTMVTKVDLKNLEEKSEKRISMASEFMNQRLIDAGHLLGSIIVDRPELPWGSISSVDTRRRNQSRSPARPDSSTSPPRLSASRSSRSPGRRKVNEATWTLKTVAASRSTYGTDISKMSRETASMKGILKSKDPQPSSADMFMDHHVLTSISEGDQSLGNSTELINYARQILENDSSERLSPLASYENIPDTGRAAQDTPQHERSSQVASRAQTPRGRSFADMVRMQRPEATRKWNAVNKHRRQQGESEKQSIYKEILAKSTAAHNPNLLKDKTKDYGSKQIPGFSPRQAGPRRVKTYSQRLQEMKPTRPHLPPAVRHQSSVSTRTVQSSARTGPPHKPQTYVEQLQNLRSKTPAPGKQADRKSPALMRTFLKAHGPKHRPKTYAEQLQDLNPHPHRDLHQRKLMQSTVTLHGPSRAKTRSRPYSDPYSDMDYEELASVLSDWDVDENIHNIIYGGLSPSSSANFVPMNGLETSLSGGDHPHAAPSYNQSDYYSTVMQGQNHYRLAGAGDEFGPDDYRSSVDIQEIERIAELASMGSDSILSVIDWDAVESLIKDV